MTDPLLSTPDIPRREQPPRRARMLRYALWQLRDYALERGLATMIIVLLVGGVFVALPIREAVVMATSNPPAEMIARYGTVDAARHALAERIGTTALGEFAGAVVFLGALLAMSGLVSNDRKQGYYRFLFAKPVSPARYYGQAFVVHLLGFLSALVLLGLLWCAVVTPIGNAAATLFVMMLMYLCYAGIAFFLTVVSRWDWLSLVVVWLVSATLWGRFGTSRSAFATLLVLFPPVPRADDAYRAVAQHLPLPWHSLLWLAGYGLACVLAGLLVLRHRRLAIP